MLSFTLFFLFFIFFLDGTRVTFIVGRKRLVCDLLPKKGLTKFRARLKKPARHNIYGVNYTEFD